MDRSRSIGRKISVIFCAVLSGSIALAGGCVSPSDRNNAFVVAIDSAPTQFDPRLATDAYSERIGQLLFSRLVRSDALGKIIGDLAEKWEIQSDLLYTFYLKKNILFHHGAPLTSRDVQYTYESMMDPTFASPHRKTYEMVQKIETPDAATVRFILKHPHAPFLSTLTKGIVPRPLPDAATLTAPPIGSGPFYFVRYTPDDAVELASYQNYFEGSPRIPKLLFRIIPEESVRLLELEKGTIDLLQNAFSPDALSRLKKDSRLKIVQAPGTTYTYIGFNLEDPLLKRAPIRRAMAMALNREEIATHLFKGLARPAESLLPVSHWAYTRPVTTTPYQPEQANLLLDQAGLMPREGVRFTLVHKTSQNELARRVAEAMQQQLSKVGIAVSIRSHEWGTFYNDIKKGNFQMFTLSWVGVDDPDIYYNIFHSQSTPPNGSNRGHYQNRLIDTLLEKGRITLEINARKRIYAKIQEILSEDLPYIHLWHTENVAVMKKEVEGYTLYPDGDFYSLKETYRRG